MKAGTLVSIDDVVAQFRHRTHFFDAATMRFFRSRLMGRAYADGRGGFYFATSERFACRGAVYARRYSVRHIGVEGDSSTRCDTVGEFQAHATARAALRECRRLAEGGAA